MLERPNNNFDSSTKVVTFFVYLKKEGI